MSTKQWKKDLKKHTAKILVAEPRSMYFPAKMWLSTCSITILSRCWWKITSACNFFPTSTEGTDWSVNAQSLDLNEKHVAAVGYKMALRNHNESSFHNKTESCVYFLPYTGMVFGNVLWCFTVYARRRLTHTNLWPLCSVSSHLHWFLSNLCRQPIIHLTSTNLEYWNYTHSYPENTHYPLKDMRGKYGLQSNKITCINTYIERHSIYQL